LGAIDDEPNVYRESLPFASTWAHPYLLVGSVSLLFYGFYYVSLRSEFRVVMPVTISALTW